MTTKIFIAVILALTVVSCNDKRAQDNPKQETPKALDDKSSSNEILSKRGYDDLVESLYNELLTKDIDLKELETKIDQLKRSKNDTTNLFDNYNEKSRSYFKSANKLVSIIKDSLLRDKMKLIVTNSLTKYNARIAKHNELLKVIEQKQMTITDLHNVLKIVKTLPLIEKYQLESFPNTKSFEGYIEQQDLTIKLADTLSKK